VKLSPGNFCAWFSLSKQKEGGEDCVAWGSTFLIKSKKDSLKVLHARAGTLLLKSKHRSLTQIYVYVQQREHYIGCIKFQLKI